MNEKRLSTCTPKNALNMNVVRENGLERYDVTSSNSLPALLHFKSLDSVCLHCLMVLVKSFALLVADCARFVGKSPCENVKKEFLATSGSPFPCTPQANFQLPF